MIEQSPKSRVVLFCPGIPHRNRGASSVLFFHYIKSFVHRGYSVLNVLLLDPAHVDDPALHEYQSSFGKNDKIQFEIFFAKSFVRLGRVTADLDIETLDATTIERIRVFAPDSIFCLDFLSTRIARVVFPKKLNRFATWLGDLNFETQWYHALYALKENRYRGLKLYYRLALTAIRCQHFIRDYRQTLREVRIVIASSKSGEKRLARVGISSTYLPYPWPEETALTELPAPTKPTFLFLGTLAALGSRSAFHFMDGQFYKRLVDLWGPEGFEILITGSMQMPAWAQQMFETRPQFKLMGFVDDLTALMRSCHAVIVPIDVPVGNRSRVVTAMANQVLVVAHRNVALGNPALVDQETCLLASDTDGFVAAMKRTVDDRAYAQMIISKARRAYEDNFEVEIACAELHRRLDPLLRVDS